MQMRCVAPGCGRVFEASRASAKTCSDACRQRLRRNPAAAAAAAAAGSAEVPPPAPVTAVHDALYRELHELGVAESYEGVVTLGIARQLDNGSVSGTAYTSLSKELDRRVADLRRRAPRAEDKTQQAQAAVAERRLRLA